MTPLTIFTIGHSTRPIDEFRGIDAREITSGIRTRPHALTPWARVNGTQITYPAARDASDPISGEAEAARFMGGTLKRVPSLRPRR